MVGRLSSAVRAISRLRGGRTAKLTQFLRRHLPLERTSPIRYRGWTIHFIHEWTLKYLIREIFTEEEYFFIADTESPVILDCGANIGMSVLYFKTIYPEARITAFEPFAPAFARLHSNVRANKLENVSIHNVLLSDHHGPAALSYDPDNPASLSMSVREERIKGAKQLLDGVLLSDYIHEPVDLLKIDVEGAEVAILRDLSYSGKIAQVKQMIIEYHHHIVPGEDELSSFLGVLEKHGFGYRIGAAFTPREPARQFQDVLIHAYAK